MLKVVLFWIELLVLIRASSADLSKRLHYYETIHHTHVKSRVRRSADQNPASHLHQIWFNAYSRSFHFMLHQSSILPRDFHAKYLRKNKVELFHVPQSDFLVGRLVDDDSSHVEAHWEGQYLTASVTTAKDVFIVEPSWRHLGHSSNHSMIVYRQRDLIQSSPHNMAGINLPASFCGVDNSQHYKNNTQKYTTLFTDHKHVRLKRQTSPTISSNMVCELVVVADYKFHKYVGGESKHFTANYIIGILNRVNSIYMQTRWPDDNSDITGLGFQITEMKIHEDYTTGAEHYNMQKDTWNTTHLLQVFSRGTDFKDFCLAHLFTYHKFTRGVLGLAYIAGRGSKQPGGICSTGPSAGKVFTLNGYASTFNTGWSSAQNSEGNRVLSLEASLVTAHGHNWGSEHDNAGCIPTNGGNYLMYQYSVTGYDPNNLIFSSCSKRYIYNVIKTKSSSCFKDRKSSAVCGNGRIEGTEECDAGWNGDTCCTADCHLRAGTGAICSPMNYECCSEDCRVADQGTICHSLVDDRATCKNMSLCNGVDKDCPPASNKKDNSSCIDGGKCRNGVCLNFCEIRGKVPCICPQKSGFACYRCCKLFPNDTECIPESPYEQLPNGRPCFQGTCSNGKCEKQISDVVQRLFSIIESITADEFVDFMKSNIVATIVIFSLLIWIPASCTFSHFDKKRERKIRGEHNRWKSRSTYTLLLEEDKRKFPHVRLKNVGGSVIRHHGNPIHLTQSLLNSSHNHDMIKESKV
ncbi:hypothetical protein FSP39_003734 [Pinctada imbricata]|uniref:ADAM 17-like protease n=1 Tax=Pinctada imbricata TaxID=66713 RepID=A0AA88XH78_PINIB|nr:hypothetical protein FSP39_003734 [Pinctada imbricata]